MGELHSGILQSPATDFGAGDVLTCLTGILQSGILLSGILQVGILQSPATDFGAGDVLTCSFSRLIEAP